MGSRANPVSRRLSAALRAGCIAAESETVDAPLLPSSEATEVAQLVARLLGDPSHGLARKTELSLGRAGSLEFLISLPEYVVEITIDRTGRTIDFEIEDRATGKVTEEQLDDAAAVVKRLGSLRAA